jgi:(S)-ureidoglycine aminohydrolase
MDPFGTTRSRLARDHALIAPDSFVRCELPGWTKTLGIILIAPRMGAEFVQFVAEMAPGGTSGNSAQGVERVIFVLEGEVVLAVKNGAEYGLGEGGFAYVPPGAEASLRSSQATRLNVFEKRYSAQPGVDSPGLICGNEHDVVGQPFLGDPAARLQMLLPSAPGFDLAVNIFTYDPGATLPMVESHVMEHGLLMLAGEGVYRLGDSWYPVREGDVIWMAPYCPQWFVAMGKSPARYLYYKDVNRDPLALEPELSA